jgi:hypothetical protein
MNEVLLGIDALEKIGELMGAMTDDHVKRAESRLVPPKEGEKPLGTLHNITARRLWALHSHLKAKAITYKAESEVAVTDSLERELEMEALRFKEYSETSARLFWLQVHHDIGYWEDGVGVRKDWMIVQINSEPPNPLEAIRRHLSGIDD